MGAVLLKILLSSILVSVIIIITIIMMIITGILYTISVAVNQLDITFTWNTMVRLYFNGWNLELILF